MKRIQITKEAVEWDILYIRKYPEGSWSYKCRKYSSWALITAKYWYQVEKMFTIELISERIINTLQNKSKRETCEDDGFQIR